MAALAGNHTRHDDARHPQEALDVGVYHRFPVVEATFVFGLQAQGQAGIVDEDVHLVPLRGQAGYGFLGGLAVADVEAEGKRFRTLGGQLGLNLLQPASVPPGQYKAVARLGKLPGAGQPDTAGGAGDENNYLHIG